jgi:hypothetical protein
MSKQLLFLDFDGVMHPNPPGEAGPFVHMPLLADWLRERREILVVISSSWAHTGALSVDELVCLFPEDLQSRVIGATQPGQEDERFLRNSEISRYLAENRIEDAPWVALDDDAASFYTGWPKLVLCASKTGLTEERLSAVAKALAEQAGPEPFAGLDEAARLQVEAVLAWLQEELSVSGDPQRMQFFDLEAWLARWLHQPNRSLGYGRPVDLLAAPDGADAVIRLLQRMLYGAYS